MSEAAIDAVCGMPVFDERFVAGHRGASFRFCSMLCRDMFVRHPTLYAPTDAPPPRIAYFSMEVAIDQRIPTYAGGLGVLAGDTLKSCADLGLPVVAVSLVHRAGYFKQQLDSRGNQVETPSPWRPEEFLHPLPERIEVRIERRPVMVRAWRYDLTGASGSVVPLLLLDTDMDANSALDREITHRLYGGDDRERLAQEVVLGIGGVRMLRALGHAGLRRFHMNEGHSSLLALELLRTAPARPGEDWNFAAVRERCLFTTHTPVAAGHDRFDWTLADEVLGDLLPTEILRMVGGRDRLNLTLLALNSSGHVNGVAKRHGVVTQEMFPGYPIDSITNGVHARSWTCPAFRELFDRHLPGWLCDPFSLRHALGIPLDEVRAAHCLAKQALIDEVNRRGGGGFTTDAFTIGFARRATHYKRADLLFNDPDRLAAISAAAGTIQLVFAGKAHPNDSQGKEQVRRVFEYAARLNASVRFAYLADYDVELAGMLTSGSDLWLNTPMPPLETSGTSGMKAALNGVPSLSVPDGWWAEGCIEGVTGWTIGSGVASADGADAQDLYRKLEDVILPLYRDDPDRWTDVMRHAIALNGSFFNTHRMVLQYAAVAWAGAGGP